MATIKKRNGKYCVIYQYTDADGNRKQKWETYSTKAEAERRKKVIEEKERKGTLSVPQCERLKDLLDEFVSVYGTERWAISTFDHNMSLINNYIVPIIGETLLSEVNTHFLEKYYQELLKTPAVPNMAPRKEGTVGPSVIRDVHKLLKCCFGQAVKWELMEKNPALNATVPKYKSAKREIWNAESLMHATEVCEDEQVKLAMNLAFSGSLRIGELAALTWDCVDVTPEAIREKRAFIYINKELQRVKKKVIERLDGKGVLLTFPSENRLCSTVRVLKVPKTETSIRRVYIPEFIADLFIAWKKEQDDLKKLMGKEYHDYGLVFATNTGFPTGDSSIRKHFKKLIRNHALPKVDFHSLRHTSVTYKLKLTGGDIKSVQGDSGHAQVDMVTDVYSHIMDEDRRKIAELLQEAFYEKKNLNPQIHNTPEGTMMALPEGFDAELLAKALSNPEMAALLMSIIKGMQK